MMEGSPDCNSVGGARKLYRRPFSHCNLVNSDPFMSDYRTWGGCLFIGMFAELNNHIYCDLLRYICRSTEHLAVTSRAEAASHLGELMVYFQQQEETTPVELLVLKRMRDHTARKPHSKLTQQKLTKFFQKN
ncbi:hypothetical protein J6590_060775 [Homalodisca vitripennis]|nr:hypothetical protein J6590_060775 [Homalodisca vitripennis]